MARQIKQRERKPYIIVFWEGESEESYMHFMRAEFQKYANVTVCKEKGVFRTAKKSFSKKGCYYDETTEIDEIWLVFDTETDLKSKWDEYFQIIKNMRRFNDYITVRLLMTKGCIEYFFLLHFEKSAPLIQTPADKNAIENKLRDKKYSLNYKKGDKDSIWKIAENYMTAIDNSKWSLKNVELTNPENVAERERQLFLTDATFSNVYEGIEKLVQLKDAKSSLV